MLLEKEIEEALTQAFSPDRLEVVNESRMHAGHNQEAAETNQTHFRIRIAAPSLAAMSRVNAHRAINEKLAFAFDKGLHALAIEIARD